MSRDEDLTETVTNLTTNKMSEQSEEEEQRPPQDRLRAAPDKDQRGERDVDAEGGKKPSIRERLDDVLNKPRERLEIEDEPEKDREVENEREIDREIDRDPGLSH